MRGGATSKGRRNLTAGLSLPPSASTCPGGKSTVGDFTYYISTYYYDYYFCCLDVIAVKDSVVGMDCDNNKCNQDSFCH